MTQTHSQADCMRASPDHAFFALLRSLLLGANGRRADITLRSTLDHLPAWRQSPRSKALGPLSPVPDLLQGFLARHRGGAEDFRQRNGSGGSFVDDPDALRGLPVAGRLQRGCSMGLARRWSIGPGWTEGPTRCSVRLARGRP